MLHRDGLMDALFGILFLAAAVVGILDQISAPDGLRIATLVLIQLSGVVAMTVLKRRYVAPRVGRVAFSSRRVKRTKSLRILLAACVAVTVLLVILTAVSGRPGSSLFGDVGKIGVWLTITAVVVVPIAGIALFLDFPRLLIYAGLFSAVEFLHVVVELPKRVPFGAVYAYGAASLVAFTIGIPIYLSFLRNTPRPSSSGESDED